MVTTVMEPQWEGPPNCPSAATMAGKAAGSPCSWDSGAPADLGLSCYQRFSSHLVGCTLVWLLPVSLSTAGHIPWWQGRRCPSSRWGWGLGPCSMHSPGSPQAPACCRPPATPAPRQFFFRCLHATDRSTPCPATCPAAGSCLWSPLQTSWSSRRTRGTRRPPPRASILIHLRPPAVPPLWNLAVSLGVCRAGGWVSLLSE